MRHEPASPFVQESLDQARQQVADFLPDRASCSNEQKAQILRKYVAAIEGNFVSWMGATAVCARSVQGRYAASENLWVEMKEDHAGMLRTFATAAHCEPGLADYQAVSECVADIRSMVSGLSGLECLTLMATLENTSGAFIPWLEEVAKELGSDQLRYTKIHGEADIEHADQFAWAVTHELSHYEHGEQILKQSVVRTVEFLKKIFTT